MARIHNTAKSTLALRQRKGFLLARLKIYPDGYDGAAIRDWGHLRWKIENNAFGELTDHWPLTHSAHHKPVALLWIKIIAFTLFHAFAILHGKLFRLSKVTLLELRKRIYRSLLCGWPIRYLSEVRKLPIGVLAAH